MRPQDTNTLYIQVVHVTNSYLGPAADRFITRQIQNHLQIEPSELSQTDLLKLIDWVRVAVSFITEDSSLVEEYVNRLQQLTGTPNGEHRHAAKRT